MPLSLIRFVSSDSVTKILSVFHSNHVRHTFPSECVSLALFPEINLYTCLEFNIYNGSRKFENKFFQIALPLTLIMRCQHQTTSLPHPTAEKIQIWNKWFLFYLTQPYTGYWGYLIGTLHAFGYQGVSLIRTAKIHSVFTKTHKKFWQLCRMLQIFDVLCTTSDFI